MGALRNPELPSPPLETRDRPHPISVPSPVVRTIPVDYPFVCGVAGAVVGATLMVVGAATASAPILWIAVALIALAGWLLRLSTKTKPRHLTIRD